MSQSAATTPEVVTGLDLPAGSPGGSVELLYDLYAGPSAALFAQTFMLAGDPDEVLARPAGPRLHTLPVTGKCLEGPPFWRYVDALAAALRSVIHAPSGAVIHLQHLAFGAAPALLRAFPGHRYLALIHGTDLLSAEGSPTQHAVLREIARSATALVVPTMAMADRLIRIHPATRPKAIIHVPWGVPDRLLAAPAPGRSPCQGALRVLYAGRLTAEKGFGNLLRASCTASDVDLSVAAPPGEYAAAISARSVLRAVRPNYLGWLPREKLWRAFADHDVLAVPSAVCEAFGLIAIEAQACGCPSSTNRSRACVRFSAAPQSPWTYTLPARWRTRSPGCGATPQPCAT